MSITEELRMYVQDWRDTPSLMDGLDRGDVDGILEDFIRIADRIDERYKRDMATAQQVGYNEGEDAAMRSGWVELPKDANGVPIHVGDVMKGEKIGGGFSEPFEVVGYIMSNGELEPMDEHKLPRKHVYLHHHQPDSWEGIITDALKFAGNGGVPIGARFADYAEEFVERCRRLAGEGE